MDIDSRHIMYVLYFTQAHDHIHKCGKKCGTRTLGGNMCRHLLACLWTWNLGNYCCIYDLFRFNPRFGTRPVQAPFQQTDAHPCGRSQWLRPLLLSWCWRPGLQHWLPSGNSSRRKSEPGRKSSEEQQMLAMSAAKTEPHLSVPWWVLHWVTVLLCQLCLTILSLSPLFDYKRIQLCKWMELVHVQCTTTRNGTMLYQCAGYFCVTTITFTYWQQTQNAKPLWVCLKMGYTPKYSHLVGIVIINHLV